MNARGGTATPVAWDQKCPATRGRGACTCPGARKTTAVPLPAVDLTPGAAAFIASATGKLGRVANLARNLPGGVLGEPAIGRLAEIGVQYDPDVSRFFCQDPTGLRVSITMRDGAADFAVSQEVTP